MIAAVIHVVGETRSFERAELTLRDVLGHAPSPKTVSGWRTRSAESWRRSTKPKRRKKRWSSPRWPLYRVMAAAFEPVTRMLLLGAMAQPGARPRTRRLNE